jgi:hypothetical protein
MGLECRANRPRPKTLKSKTYGKDSNSILHESEEVAPVKVEAAVSYLSSDARVVGRIFM